MLKHFCVLGELRQNMSFTAASLSPTSDFFQRKPHAPFYLPSDSSCQQEVKSSRSTRLLSVDQPVNEQLCICITDDTPIHLSYSCLTFQSPLIHEKDTELPKVFHLWQQLIAAIELALHPFPAENYGLGLGRCQFSFSLLHTLWRAVTVRAVCLMKRTESHHLQTAKMRSWDHTWLYLEILPIESCEHEQNQ